MVSRQLVVLFLLTCVSLLGFFSMELYRNCKVNLGMAMFFLYLQPNLFWLFILINTNLQCCMRDCWNLVGLCLTIFFSITFATNMVLCFVYVIIVQFKSRECLSFNLLLVDWVVTGLGTGTILIVVIALLCYAFVTMKERYEINKAQKQLEQLYTIIYDPTVNVVSLIEKYKDRLMTEPLKPQEIAVLRDFFGEKYASNQEHIVEEELKEACIICLEPFGLNQELIRFPVCSHQYHWVCLDMWIQQNLNCPMCKRDLRLAMVTGVRSKGRQKAKQAI